MEKNARIYVAGHSGMVGSAIVRQLTINGFKNILTASSAELNLTNQSDTNTWFESNKPEYVFVAAAKVGGIIANNTYRAEFIYNNIMIAANTIHAAYKHKVKKLLFLGSTCIYPRLAPQPLKEDYLLTGSLEPTNEPYAIAKIAGIKMCEAYRQQYQCDFISVMPTNLYGPNDNYDLQNAHVLPALIRRFHEAKLNNIQEIIIWGTGRTYREFLHVDDLADAVCMLMQKYSDAQFVNCGSGNEISIGDLALLIKKIVGYHGELKFDTTKPDGTPRKLTDITKLRNMGWKPKITLEDGIASVYDDFVTRYPKVVSR